MEIHIYTCDSPLKIVESSLDAGILCYTAIASGRFLHSLLMLVLESWMITDDSGIRCR